MQQAKAELLQGGQTPGSPQLNSFGPNMRLAQKLLEQGEAETVVQYLELCGRFWRMDRGQLSQWIKTIQDGGTPDMTSQVY